ncbi:hypothetical protein Tco_0226876 [Tanacetum coccineum]
MESEIGQGLQVSLVIVEVSELEEKPDEVDFGFETIGGRLTRISLIDKLAAAPGVHIFSWDVVMVHVDVSGWTVFDKIDLQNSSATSDETAWVEELVLILATTALFLD